MLIPTELNQEDYHSELLLTEQEIYELVMKRISQFDDVKKQEVEKRLYEELNDGRCKCFTGRITRMINALVGFDDNILIGISDNEQIMNIYDMLKQQNKLTKENYRKELEERGYDEATISLWVDAIEE